eukprot:scaffold27110_cov46-Prasinocladus_malaysianus.AAC.1
MSPASMSSLGLHGTGTPLGDPIEIGAAMACVCNLDTPWNNKNAERVFLQANKSSVGHGEAAAGISALHFAAEVLTRKGAKSILHLQGLNPHVAVLLPACASSMPKPDKPVMLSRNDTPSPTIGTAFGGVSSFAYQLGSGLAI